MPDMSVPSTDSRLLDEHPPILSLLQDIGLKRSDPVGFLSTAAEKMGKRTVQIVPSGRPRNVKNDSKENNSIREENTLGIDFSDVLAELRTELDVKRREEEKLQRDIADILIQSSIGGSDMGRAFSFNVSRMNNSLLIVEKDTKQLANSLKVVSKLANNISSKVSALDVAKTRVVECLQLAGDMRDLGVCSEGVDAAIREEDYEQAAQHIHRFLTLDKAVFQLRDSVDKEAGQSVRHSYDVLTAAASRLKEILETRLIEAVDSKDIGKMQRFVKLFPLINEHATGLNIFGKFVVAQIEKIGQDNLKVMYAGGTDDNRRNVLYADTMFLFFEDIARIVETNQPLIENSYGSDRLLDFIQMLQVEIDRVIGVVLCEFMKSRQFDQKARMVEKWYRNAEKTGEQGKLDALILDVLLSEVTQMHTRAEMYWRFLKRRIGENKKNAEEDDDDNDDDDMDVDTQRKKEEERKRRRETREYKLDTLLNRSLVGTKMQELLGRYILMEQYYMEETVNKAIDMDLREEGQLMSSVVDDVLFIVRKCVRRALTSGSVDCACAAINNGCTLLETTFHNYLSSAIQAGYPAVGFAAEAFQTAQTAYNVLQHGKTVTEARPDAQREAFLTALNNARGGSEMISELRKGLALEISKVQRQAVDAAKLEHSLGQFDEVVAKMRTLADNAIHIITQTAFRPKLRNSCEQYLVLPHTLTDEQLADYEASDPWVETFTGQLDRMLAAFEVQMHSENYQYLLLSVCTEVCKQFERVIYKCTFNRLGGLQLDKEYRQLTGYLSGVAGWSARERCARLSQIVSLLNLDSVDEAVDLVAHSAYSASLGETEVKKTLSLRMDLSTALIQQLRL